MKILIHNGRVIDPASGRDEAADIAIANGRILTIGRVPADFEADRRNRDLDQPRAVGPHVDGQRSAGVGERQRVLARLERPARR